MDCPSVLTEYNRESCPRSAPGDRLSRREARKAPALRMVRSSVATVGDRKDAETWELLPHLLLDLDIQTLDFLVEGG
jgi:hypothetical protein